MQNTSITTSWPCLEHGLRVGDKVSIPYEWPRPWYARLWRQIRWRLFRIKDKPKTWVITEIASSGDCIRISPHVSD